MTKLPLLLAAATLTVAASSHAANFYWDAGTVTVNGVSAGGTGAWTVGAAGWEDGTSAQNWADGNLAVFGGAASTVTLGGNISATGLQFSNTGAYTLTGAATARILSIGTSGIDMSAATADVNFGSNITVAVGGNSQSWNVATGRTLSLSSVGLNGTLTGTSAATITVAGGGLVDILPTATGAGGYAGNWLVQGGSTLRSARNQAAAFGTGTITLNGGTLAVGGVAGSGAQGNWTFNNAITLGVAGTNFIDNQLPNSGTNRWLKLDGVMSGAGGVTFKNTTAATMNNDEDGIILARTNTFTGNMVISAGTFVRIGGAAAGTTTLDAGNNGSIDASVAVTNAGVLRLTRTDTWTLANSISGAGQVKIGGTVGSVSTASQQVTLSGANTYTGATTVVNGRLNLTSTNASAITVNSGATLGGTGSTTGLLTMNGGSLLALAGGAATTAFTSNGVNFAGATQVTFDSALTTSTVYDVLNYGTGTVTNAGNLTAAARGTIAQDLVNNKFTFTAGAVATRTWNTTSGTWDNYTTANFAEGDQKFSFGDTVVFNDPVSASTVTLTGSLAPASVSVTNTNAYTFSGTGSIAGATTTLTKAGAGTLILATNNTYGGGTTITAGTLQVGNAGAVGSLGTGAVANAGALVFNLTGSNTVANAISGAGTLTQAGTGTLILSGANTYTGATNITAGTLQVGNAGTTGSLGNGTGAVANAGTLAFNRTDAVTVANAISGAGALTQSGTGTTTLSGTNTYTGTTTVNAGTLTISGTTNTTAGAVTVGSGSNATLTVANGGTLTTTGTLALGAGNTGNTFNVNAGGIVNAGIVNNAWGTDVTVNGTLNVTNGYTVGTNATKFIAGSGTINAASFTTSNAATIVNFTSTGSMNLTGATSITASTALNQSAGTINTSGLVVSGAANSYVMTGGRINIGAGGITGTQSASLGAGTVGAQADWSGSRNMTLTDAATGTTFNTLDSVGGVTARNITLSGVLSGAGQLVKAGAGTLTLSGTNTYAGTTSVNGGTLLINGAQTTATGAITVASGATLGGTGTLGGTATVTGTLQGGAGTAATGTLTTTGAVTLASGSIVQLALGAPGSASTIAIGAGGITLQSDQAFTFLNIGGAAAPGTYTLITGAGAQTTSGWTITNSGWAGTFTDTAGTITLNLTAVPEPSTYGLIGAGALAAVAFVRRRKKMLK